VKLKVEQSLKSPPTRLGVCMLVMNDMSGDPRVSRHAETLARYGFDVTVVCLLSRDTVAKETRDGYVIIRTQSGILNRFDALLASMKHARMVRGQSAKGSVASVQSPEKEKLSVKKKYLRWLKQRPLVLAKIILPQLAILRAARKINAHVICANDLDTLLTGFLAARFDRVLIYDSHELYVDTLRVRPFLRRILQSFEKILINRAQSILTVNELIAEVLVERCSIKKPVNVVYNCPAEGLARFPRKSRAKGRKIVLYQGKYTSRRGLENLILAAQYFLPDVHLVLRGYGDLEEELRLLARGSPNVHFEKPVAMEKVVVAARTSDVGIVSYLPTDLNNYLASPNKLFEYIQAGLPLATSNSPFMSKVVLENDIGGLFDPNDPRDIARALNKATRTEELERFRKNVVRAAARYNWKSESRKLIQIYVTSTQSFYSK